MTVNKSIKINLNHGFKRNHTITTLTQHFLDSTQTFLHVVLSLHVQKTNNTQKYPKIPKSTQKYPKSLVYRMIIEKKSSPNSLKMQSVVRSRFWTLSMLLNGVKRLSASFCKQMSGSGFGRLYRNKYDDIVSWGWFNKC